MATVLQALNCRLFLNMLWLGNPEAGKSCTDELKPMIASRIFGLHHSPPGLHGLFVARGVLLFLTKHSYFFASCKVIELL